jgi:hypothetical protein
VGFYDGYAELSGFITSDNFFAQYYQLLKKVLMMEATSTSETSVNFYQTTRRYNPEDSHLHTRRRENLKSHSVSV